MDGDTIFVYSGIYRENIIINKRINLVGENKYNTIIDACKKGSVIKTYVDNITIYNFTLKNSSEGGWYAAIYAFVCNNSIISDCIIYGKDYGIIASYYIPHLKIIILVLNCMIFLQNFFLKMLKWPYLLKD